MSTTRELNKWLDEQLARGCLPEDMIASMIGAGHAPTYARNSLAQALQRRAGPQAAPPTAGMSTPQPLAHALSTGSSTLVTPDKTVQVLVSLKSPKLIVFAGVLSDEECGGIIDAARPKMKRSETVDRVSGASEMHPARTSEGTYFTHDESSLLTRVNRRLAALTAWPLENGEPLQILHYGVGAEYEPHYDYFDWADSGTARLTAVGGQRVGTLIVYLNTPEGGGATAFPDLGLEVAAIKGNAVFFAYDRANPDTKTLHAGTPVTRGEKWIATRWMRERPYCS